MTPDGVVIFQVTPIPPFLKEKKFSRNIQRVPCRTSIQKAPISDNPDVEKQRAPTSTETAKLIVRIMIAYTDTQTGMLEGETHERNLRSKIR